MMKLGVTPYTPPQVMHVQKVYLVLLWSYTILIIDIDMEATRKMHYTFLFHEPRGQTD